MTGSRKILSADDLGILFFLAALIFGAWFRLYVPHTADFPINDGGLFHAMIDAVRANDFRLPEHVRYNGLEIPFAYPPLAFYLGAAVGRIQGAPVVEILSWMPAITLVVLIPAVYSLALRILGSRLKAGLAALVYAVLPAALTWTIMGGGITRSLGQLFHVLAISSLFLLFTRGNAADLIRAILFSALVSLTHPEAALHTIGIALLLLLVLSRNRTGLRHALMVAGGVLIVTSPWWITMLQRYGPAPFLSTARTGLHGFSHAIALFVPFSGEPFLTAIALLAVVGAAAQIAKREYLLPAWYIVPFLIEPRGAVNVAVFPMVLLASTALSELILPAVARFEAVARGMSFERVLQSRSEKILFAYLLGSMLISMQFYVLNLAGNRLSGEARASLEWVRENTPPSGRFLVLTGRTDVFGDFTNEWFPILTRRLSLTTVQGLEWIAGSEFSERVQTVQALQRCDGRATALDCVESTAGRSGLVFDHIVVHTGPGGSGWGSHLITHLEDSADYELIHEGGEIVVFRRTK